MAEGIVEPGVMIIESAENGKAGGELGSYVDVSISAQGQEQEQGQGKELEQGGGAGIFDFLFFFAPGEPDTADNGVFPDTIADDSAEELLAHVSVESKEKEAISRAMSRVLRSVSEVAPTPQNLEMSHSQINDVLALLTRRFRRMSVASAEN